MMVRNASVFAGLVLGLLLFTWASDGASNFSPEDAALGPFTVSRDAVFQGRDVVFLNGEDRELLRSLISARKQAKDPVALWLGASHQYAINNYHPGDENAVWHANELAHERSAGLLYVGVGLPNGNFNEFLSTYLFLRAADALPDWLIVGAVYDDLREPGVRPAVRDWLTRIDASQLADLGAVGDQLLSVIEHAPPPVATNAVDGTPQQIVEATVVDWLDAAWPPFSHRHRLSAWIVWKARATLFDIGEGLRRLGNPARKVPAVPADLQKWNEDAMAMLLNLAASDGMDVLVYKVPHPAEDGPFYHVRTRYDDFHQRLKARCELLGQTYLDLETLIPLQHWKFESALDPWHFDATGHRSLAAAIDSAVAQLSLRPDDPGSGD